MWKSFEKLAQANKNHYDKHPEAHMAYIGLYVVGVSVVGFFGLRKLAKLEEEARITGHY